MRVPPDVDNWYRAQADAALASCAAPVCGRSGSVTRRCGPDELDYTVTDCPCIASVRRKARLIHANVPVEFWRAEHDVLEWNAGHFEVVKDYAGDLDTAMSDGRGLLLFGENGVGKTFSACHVLARALSQGYTAGYLTAQAFTTHTRASWNDPVLKAWLDTITTADLLVLDEVGKEHRANGSEWVAAEFDTLLRARRGDLKPTIIISNLTMVQFKERYGVSLWSIMRDRMTVLQYAPGDYRAEAARRHR
jgi:DNA replication protein DnaC